MKDNNKRKRPGLSMDNFGIPKDHSGTAKVKLMLLAIDKEVQKFVHQIVNDSVQDAEDLYFKTEFKGVLYSVSMYSSTTNAIACKDWPVIQFLEMGAGKKLEMELNTVVKKLILTVKDPVNKYDETQKDKVIRI